MGPSGAGKSTLLDGLAGRIASGSLKGKVSLDGRLMSPGLIKRTSAYVMQDDRLFPMLTVYETLLFAADFRLGAIPIYEKKDRVEKLIEQLGLNTYIGDEGTRGVSGGERRRVSIGVDIIHGPSLLFLDEPTSGLDSTSAHSVIEKVRGIAESGSTVILTIHQPSSRILLLLDHLIILARGQLMFQGSPRDVSLHLGRMGKKVPKGENSIEFLIDIIQEYDHSDYTVNENDYLTPNAAISSRRDPTGHGSAKFANSFFHETWILIRRNFKNIRRTPELFLSRLMVLTVMGFMMATMFMNPKSDLQGITNRLSFMIFTVCLFFFSSNDAVPAFIQERFIFVRETSHNAYRASSYTIAGVITYLPFLLLQSGVYAAIVWKALKLRGPFHYFLLVLYVSLLSTNSFVVFVSSVVPNYILGYASVIAFTALFFLFCGYFLNSADIPPYWKWMNKISTITYPYEGLLMNQYQTDEVFGTTKEGPITGFGILNSLNISGEESEKWKKIAVMLGWAAFYRVLFYIVLRFFSKNQRS
ncbi:ABC transporter G family member STR2 [Linum perenne]